MKRSVQREVSVFRFGRMSRGVYEKYSRSVLNHEAWMVRMKENGWYLLEQVHLAATSQASPLAAAGWLEPQDVVRVSKGTIVNAQKASHYVLQPGVWLETGIAVLFPII